MSSRRHNPENALAAPTANLPTPHGVEPTYFLPKVEPGRFAAMLVRRSWMVAVPVLLGGLTALWFAERLPKTYVSKGSVYVSTQAPMILDVRAVAPEETRDLDQMRSVEQGFRATTLLMRVIEANHLNEDPTFAPAGSGAQTVLGLLASNVGVELRRGTRIIEFSVKDHDPVRAQRLAASLVEEYEKWATERQMTITRQASEGLAREEERLRSSVDATARKLQQFRESHPVPGLESSESGGPVRDSLAALTSQLTQATADRLRLEAEYEAYVKFDSSSPDSLAGVEKTERGAEVLALVRAVQLKEAEFGRVKERYLFKHPVYREVAGEIATLKSQLADTVRSAGQALQQRYQISKDNETKLSAQVSQARQTAVETEGVREQFRVMTREAEAERALHASVALRLRETGLAATVPASVLRWEDMPMVPGKPSGPRKPVFAAAGAFAGFLCGLGLLMMAKIGNRRVRNSATAARATGSPMLVSLPAVSNPGDGMVLMTDPASAGAEAFRRLRVVLAPQAQSTAGRTVMFTSARAGEGKSFCALNHASALAMQGHRTLLLDADMRTTGVSRDHLDPANPDFGLGGFLSGKSEPASACHATALPNLYVLSSGPMRPDAAELLSGTRFPSLLEDAYRWFDRVVIDAPPVLSVSDAISIAAYADRCCLVVREGSSDRRELRRASELLRSSGGNLVGFVWNEIGKSKSSYSTGPTAPVNRPGLNAPQPVAVAESSSSNSIAIVETFA